MAVFVLKATIATLESRSGKANRYVVKIGAKTIDVNGELSAVMIFFAENWGFKGWFICMKDLTESMHLNLKMVVRNIEQLSIMIFKAKIIDL